MIVTKKLGGWESKVNFIDENDVFLGYDLHQDCCEYADYFISHSQTEGYDFDGNSSIPPSSLEGYVFDTSFFELVESSCLDDGEQVCFRATKDGCDDLYIHIFNAHNGYYSHGFELSVGGKTLRDGYL